MTGYKVVRSKSQGDKKLQEYSEELLLIAGYKVVRSKSQGDKKRQAPELLAATCRATQSVVSKLLLCPPYFGGRVPGKLSARYTLHIKKTRHSLIIFTRQRKLHSGKKGSSHHNFDAYPSHQPKTIVRSSLKEFVVRLSNCLTPQKNDEQRANHGSKITSLRHGFFDEVCMHQTEVHICVCACM